MELWVENDEDDYDIPAMLHAEIQSPQQPKEMSPSNNCCLKDLPTSLRADQSVKILTGPFASQKGKG